MWGFLAGAAAGTVAGILLAPDKGSATRTNIKNSAAKFGEDFNASVQKGFEKFNEFKNSAFSLVNKYNEEQPTQGGTENPHGY